MTYESERDEKAKLEKQVQGLVDALEDISKDTEMKQIREPRNIEDARSGPPIYGRYATLAALKAREALARLDKLIKDIERFKKDKAYSEGEE